MFADMTPIALYKSPASTVDESAVARSFRTTRDGMQNSEIWFAFRSSGPLGSRVMPGSLREMIS